ncbi:MAG: hypothetical protein NC132_03140 [Corallococcus sp.]|nr:hypothetical protein [Corallococcus sp.]MCM1359102.1 hypothetical protein [Corallococcus sp.]MCM1395091.1 hypothetical protein [Corallococcus sp.]
MKNYKEMDQLVFEFGDDLKYFAQNHAGAMPPVIKTRLQDLMYTKFSKELDAMEQQEQLEVKFKKRFYDKLLKAKLRLANKDRADAWFDKVFSKYFNKGLLEHLIVYAVKFLRKKDLFVPQRLFTQLNDDELLVRFTLAACERLGWTGQNDAAEQPTTDETEQTEEQAEPEKTSDGDAEQATNEAESTEVTVYEPKPVQPIDQPVVKVERTVTHEVMTATSQSTVQNQTAATGTDEEPEAVTAEAQATSVKSEEKTLPPFYRKGGKSGNK